MRCSRDSDPIRRSSNPSVRARCVDRATTTSSCWIVSSGCSPLGRNRAEGDSKQRSYALQHVSALGPPYDTLSCSRGAKMFACDAHDCGPYSNGSTSRRRRTYARAGRTAVERSHHGFADCKGGYQVKAGYVTLISRSRELGMSISRETELKHDGNNHSLAYQRGVLLQLDSQYGGLEGLGSQSGCLVSQSKLKQKGQHNTAIRQIASRYK
jgi:hypothetical protein